VFVRIRIAKAPNPGGHQSTISGSRVSDGDHPGQNRGPESQEQYGIQACPDRVSTRVRFDVSLVFVRTGAKSGEWFGVGLEKSAAPEYFDALAPCWAVGVGQTLTDDIDRLAAGEDRLSFFDKGGDAFLGVFGGRDLAEFARQEIERFFKR
jgi:hypothetical protein